MLSNANQNIIIFYRAIKSVPIGVLLQPTFMASL